MYLDVGRTVDLGPLPDVSPSAPTGEQTMDPTVARNRLILAAYIGSTVVTLGVGFLIVRALLKPRKNPRRRRNRRRR